MTGRRDHLNGSRVAPEAVAAIREALAAGTETDRAGSQNGVGKVPKRIAAIARTDRRSRVNGSREAR